jgi:iron complex outermembrane receptor protein
VIPSNIPLSTRYNTPQDHLTYTRADFQLKYNHAFSADTKLTETIAYANDSYQYFSSEELYLTSNKDSVQRGFFNFNTHLKPLQNTIELNSKWKTGSVTQNFTVGNSINYIDWSQTSDGNLPTPTTVAAVNPIETQLQIPLLNDQRHILQEISTALYLQDLIDFSKKLKGLIGLRYDYFDGKYRHDNLNASNTFVNGPETNRTSNAVTYRFGLVYEPVQTVSIYGSYSNYFQPVRDIPLNDIVLKPTTGYMGEVGAKIALSDKFSSTTSIYYIAKSNIVISKGAGILDQAGRAVSKGIQEDLTYTPDVHWSVIAGYSYNNVRFTDYIEAGNLNLKGNRLNYAPDNLANLWATYRFAKHLGDNGFNISLGGVLTGNSFADNENTVKLPAYTIINGAVHYQFKHAELGLNVNNIFNKTEYFVSAINSTQLYPGKPANYLLSLRYKL